MVERGGGRFGLGMEFFAALAHFGTRADDSKTIWAEAATRCGEIWLTPTKEAEVHGGDLHFSSRQGLKLLEASREQQELAEAVPPSNEDDEHLAAGGMLRGQSNSI